MKVPDLILLILLLIGSGCVLAVGFGKISAFFSSGKEWRKILSGLPVLRTDGEIAAALQGEPKNYLVENYAFNRGQTVRDTAMNVLNGEYLYIGTAKETYTVNYAYSNRYRNAVWQSGPYESITGSLQFADGTELELPQDARFEFSLIDESMLKKTDINPEKQENFFMARYYPDGVYKIDTKKLGEKLKKNVLKSTQQMNSRYKFLFMRKGDTATFAARIGGGKASLNVFEGNNVIAVRGGRKALAKYLSHTQQSKLQESYIQSYVTLGLWVLFMIPAFILEVFALLMLLLPLFDNIRG